MRSGGPELRFITIEGVGYATTVDSLLAIKKFVYNDKKYTIAQIKEALLNDYKGNKDQTIMQTTFQMKAPKYGNNDDEIELTYIRCSVLYFLLTPTRDQSDKECSRLSLSVNLRKFAGRSWATTLLFPK